MRDYEIRKRIRENTVRIQERVNTVAFNCNYYPMTDVMWNTMRQKVADFLMKERATKRVEPYSVVFELDLVVLTPDAMEQLIADAAMEYGHMAKVSPMPSTVAPMVESLTQPKPTLVNIPDPDHTHIAAYKKAFEKCDNNPDDTHSPEWRGIEAVFKLLRKGNG